MKCARRDSLNRDEKKGVAQNGKWVQVEIQMRVPRSKI